MALIFNNISISIFQILHELRSEFEIGDDREYWQTLPESSTDDLRTVSFSNNRTPTMSNFGRCGRQFVKRRNGRRATTRSRSGCARSRSTDASSSAPCLSSIPESFGGRLSATSPRSRPNGPRPETGSNPSVDLHQDHPLQGELL